MNDNKCPQLICTLLLRKFREIPSKALPKEIANKAMDVIRYCEDEAILFDHKLALGKGGCKYVCRIWYRHVITVHGSCYK